MRSSRILALVALTLGAAPACRPTAERAPPSPSAKLPEQQQDVRSSAASRSPRTARVVLEVDRPGAEPTFLLGENVLVHYCLENTGPAPITIQMGGDYRGSSRALRYRVDVRDESGARAVDPDTSGVNFGGLSHEPTVAPGARYCHSVPLLRYAQLDKPGRVTVRISHDLGWERDGAKAPEGTITLLFAAPDATQAEQVVADALALPKNDGVRAGQKSKPFTDLGVLRAPVYLTPLESRVLAGHARAAEILDAIGSIATPEATRSLLRVADGPSLNLDAAQALARRMPDPELRGEIGARNPFQSPYKAERDALVAAAWRPEHGAPARALGLKLLASADVKAVVMGAYYLQCVGQAGDLVPLAAAFDRAIEATRGAPLEESMYPRPRGACGELVRAADIFAKRRLHPGAAPKSAGEIGVFLRALGADPAFRPAGWERVLDAALDHPIAYVRELALQAGGDKPPAVVVAKLRARLADADVDVQIAACHAAEKSGDPALTGPVLAILGKATERWALNAAAVTAVTLGARLEVFRTWARRLDEPAVGLEMLRELAGLIDGGHGSSGLTAADAAGVKALWVRFVEEHKAAIAAGERFEAGDPRLSPAMFPKMQLRRKDGTEWPPAAEDR